MDLNKLYEKYPNLFQFMVNDFESHAEKVETSFDLKTKVEFSKFNALRDSSSPFYKPISKIVKYRDDKP